MNRRKWGRGETENNVKREATNQGIRAGTIGEQTFVVTSCGCCVLVCFDVSKLVVKTSNFLCFSLSSSSSSIRDRFRICR